MGKIMIGISIALCGILLVGLCACNAISGTPQNREHSSPHPNENVPSNTDNAKPSVSSSASLSMDTFDAELMKMALEQNPNGTSFYSPYGAASAFVILANSAGKDSQIAKDVMKSLGYENMEQMNADFKAANEFAPLTDGYGFSSAGLVLYDETNLGGKVKLDNEIVNKLSEYLATDVKKEDFAGNLDQAKKDIQKWASDATQGFIDDFETQADAATAADILNAVYFKGKWTIPFEKAKTHGGNFTSSSGEIQTADFMEAAFEPSDKVTYYEDDKFKGIKLDYQGAAEAVSMYMVLPIDENSTNCAAAWAATDDAYKADFKSHLDTAGTEYDKLLVSIPKLEFRQKSDITKLAARIGAGAILSGDKLALFGDDVSSVKLDQIYQDAKVRIDEEGTEAAAITEMTMKATSVREQTVKTFYCDHPYVFMIAGNSNNVTYFTGLVNSIEPEMRIK